MTQHDWFMSFAWKNLSVWKPNWRVETFRLLHSVWKSPKLSNLNFCAQNSQNYKLGFWRKNSNIKVARFARNVVKWDFFEWISNTVICKTTVDFRNCNGLNGVLSEDFWWIWGHKSKRENGRKLLLYFCWLFFLSRAIIHPLWKTEDSNSTWHFNNHHGLP